MAPHFDPHAFLNRRTLVVAGIVAVALIGIASIGTTAKQEVADPMGQTYAPVAFPFGAVEGVDHTRIRFSDAVEADSTGASIAAYDN